MIIFGNSSPGQQLGKINDREITSGVREAQERILSNNHTKEFKYFLYQVITHP